MNSSANKETADLGEQTSVCRSLRQLKFETPIILKREGPPYPQGYCGAKREEVRHRRGRRLHRLNAPETVVRMGGGRDPIVLTPL